jgi:flavin reductase (DIM6/NTAB) family NADH-FMN oxidoreductase RutF/pimeloyl-ACP methyl ester carboxylesterase
MPTKPDAERPERGNILSFEGFGGIRLEGESWGHPDQPTLLLLPGGGQTIAPYRHAARTLSETGRRVICVDLRGHGRSQRSPDGDYSLERLSRDVVAILQQLDTRPVVVGASVGGVAALTAIGESEFDLASGLILVDVAAEIDALERDRVHSLLEEHLDGFATVEDAAEALRKLGLSTSLEFDLDAVERNLGEEPDGRLHWNWDARFADGLRGEDVGARLEAAAAQIRIPVLLARGTESKLVSAEAINDLASYFPDPEIAEIDGAGHLVAVDRTDDFAALLTDFLERRAPRLPLAYETGSDMRTLRDALGCFATGVTIVTTMDEGVPKGFVANSFTSVSLDPPLVLFCLATRSSRIESFKSASYFAINIVHIGQQKSVQDFVSAKSDHFDTVAWKRSEHNIPVVKDALSTFQCRTKSVTQAGDHVIVIGEVKSATFEPNRDPLLYFKGRYRRLHFG